MGGLEGVGERAGEGGGDRKVGFNANLKAKFRFQMFSSNNLCVSGPSIHEECSTSMVRSHLCDITALCDVTKGT